MDLPVAILGRLDDNFQGIERKMRCISVARKRLWGQKQVAAGRARCPHSLASSLSQAHVLRSHT